MIPLKIEVAEGHRCDADSEVYTLKLFAMEETYDETTGECSYGVRVKVPQGYMAVQVSSDGQTTLYPPNTLADLAGTGETAHLYFVQAVRLSRRFMKLGVGEGA